MMSFRSKCSKTIENTFRVSKGKPTNTPETPAIVPAEKSFAEFRKEDLYTFSVSFSIFASKRCSASAVQFFQSYPSRSFEVFKYQIKSNRIKYFTHKSELFGQ